MKKYNGYYIDNVIFHNEEEIDAFLKQQAIDAFKKAIKYFCENPTMAASMYSEEKAEVLVKQFGYTWEQVEELETNTMKEII